MKIKIFFLLALAAGMAACQTSSAPKPKAMIYGMSGGVVTTEQLLTDNFIMMDDKNSVITSFRMSAYEKDHDAIELAGSDNNLTAEMQDAISKLSSGSKVYFEYIKAKDGKGDTLTAESIAFIIK